MKLRLIIIVVIVIAFIAIQNKSVVYVNAANYTTNYKSYFKVFGCANYEVGY